MNLSFNWRRNRVIAYNASHTCGKDICAVWPTGKWQVNYIYTVLPKLWQLTENSRTVSAFDTSDSDVPLDRKSCIVMVVSLLVSLMKEKGNNFIKLWTDAVYLVELHCEVCLADTSFNQRCMGHWFDVKCGLKSFKRNKIFIYPIFSLTKKLWLSNCFGKRKL